MQMWTLTVLLTISERLTTRLSIHSVSKHLQRQTVIGVNMVCSRLLSSRVYIQHGNVCTLPMFQMKGLGLAFRAF